MSLIFIFIFLFLLSFSKEIEIQTDCPSNQHYNSLNYKCESDRGRKGFKTIYSYSYDNPISIYTFNPLLAPLSNCGNGEMLTELDGNGNLLERAQCANNQFNFDDIDSTYRIYTDNPQTIHTPINTGWNIYYYGQKEINYYRHSCIDGKYERACDFAANLCTLTLYENNGFCDIVNDLSKILNNQNIL